MKTYLSNNNKPAGSALILVVVVTVLLAVIGVMFLMVSRASELEAGAVVETKDLDAAVDTVVTRINKELVQDLFDSSGNFVANAHDATMDDPWLSDLEPDGSSGTPVWAHPSNLFGLPGLPVVPLTPDFTQNATNVSLPADADGDGVRDSYWAQIPSLTTSRGEPVFAAVRIVDNGAMLNLNAAYCFYQEPYANDVSYFETPWYATEADLTGEIPFYGNQTGSGRYVTEINYLPFLRGRDLNGTLFDGGTSLESGDGWYNLMFARGFWDVDVPLSPQVCQYIVMNREGSGSGFQFFDIGDELELRNRYFVTSKAEARFERKETGPPTNDPGVANYTLDAGGGTYGALRTPVDDTDAFNSWIIKVDPVNFDKWDIFGVPTANPDAYKYDRRHVCTFYSFDRGLRPAMSSIRYPEIEIRLSNLVLSGQITLEQADQIRRLFCTPGATSLCLYGVTSYQSMNSYECRAQIVKVLYAVRAYYLSVGYELHEAALRSAQFVVNLIDYSDNSVVGNPFGIPTHGNWNEFDYGKQLPEDCTFLNAYFINTMVREVAMRELDRDSSLFRYFYENTFDFGLEQGDIVFGYEKQPFISEVYVEWDTDTAALLGFAIELLNPYAGDIKPKPDADLPGWKIKIGDGAIVDAEIADDIFDLIPAYDTSADSPGRYVIRSSASVSVDPNIPFPYNMTSLGSLGSLFPGGNFEIQLLRPAPPNSREDYICVDYIPSDAVLQLFADGRNALKRDDKNWKFISDGYEIQQEGAVSNYTHTLGADNGVDVSGGGFQIAVADDGHPLTRWHELETLGLYGNGPDLDTTSSAGSIPAASGPSLALAGDDPNAVPTVGWQLANLEPNDVPYFDLAGDSSNLLNYVTTGSQTDSGTVPGRININTAPVHVIAAAIPPSLADPNAADPDETVAFSALQMAQEIVNYRRDNGPFETLGDLLNIPAFTQYDNGGDWEDVNVGAQSIADDIEEEHWVLSNLANKFTVRSDVFTAYILVRLGENGPQRRMIGIFDRSNVWKQTDRPKLVALHPVPDPR